MLVGVRRDALVVEHPEPVGVGQQQLARQCGVVLPLPHAATPTPSRVPATPAGRGHRARTNFSLVFGQSATSAISDVPLGLVDVEPPAQLDHGPLPDVGAGAELRHPLRRVAVALRLVDVVGDGHQRARVAEVVGVLLAGVRVPVPRAGVPRLTERDDVVDVDVGGVRPGLAVVVGEPLAGRHRAAAERDLRLRDQDLLAGVLAVAVGVDPVLEQVAVVARLVLGCDRDRLDRPVQPHPSPPSPARAR